MTDNWPFKTSHKEFRAEWSVISRRIHAAICKTVEAHRAQSRLVEDLNLREVMTSDVVWPGLGDLDHWEKYLLNYERCVKGAFGFDLAAERIKQGGLRVKGDDRRQKAKKGEQRRIEAPND
jgi:hypothetical protein